MPFIKQLWNWLDQQRVAPEPDTDDYKRWLELEEALSFLMATTAGIVPIDISAHQFYLYSMMMPEERLGAEDYVDDIMGWNFFASRGWGYGYSPEDGEARKRIFPPLDHTASRLLDHSEPLLFHRHFYGFEEGKEAYLELNQRVAHILDIHWVERRSAYCKLDANGDLKNVVEVSQSDEGCLTVVDSDELELYLFLTDAVLVRVFDVIRYKGHPWSDPLLKDCVALKEGSSELHALRVLTSSGQSHLRGFQIIRQRTSDEVMMEVVRGGERQPRQYASFIVLDWKHNVVTERSCAPDQLGNYFVPSDLPFEISPAFFRSEVMLKYKQDPDKYTIEERTITCRGTWSLSYDINEAGQVHAYLCDLRNLPYEEQLYWRSFNEAPKAGISQRAYKTDFLAEWDSEYGPLRSLKQILANFPLAMQFGIKRSIWEIPDGVSPFSRLAYVVTDSPKEWEDQILELSRIVVDRFSKNDIRKVARALGCDNPSLGSLKLLHACLVSLGVDNEVIAEVTGPLDILWQLRSSGIAHFGDSIPDVNLREHYAGLVTSIDNSMRLLAELIEQHYFDITQDGQCLRFANAESENEACV